MMVRSIRFSRQSAVHRLRFYLKAIAPHRPILIHVNGVTSSVIESEYFYEIVDFGDMF